MSEPRDMYKAATLRILGTFQLLEFALKAYIARCYKVIGASVKGTLHFGYSAADVEAFPLERLLNVFSKLNANHKLIGRLNKLREERNHMAHRSLLITMGPMYDHGAMEDKYIEYQFLEDEVTECLSLVIAEAKLIKSPNAAQPINPPDAAQ